MSVLSVNMFNETVYEIDELDDNIQPIILELTNDINVLSTEYPDISFENISNNIIKLLNEFDLLRLSHGTQQNNLNSSKSEVDLLVSKLDIERTRRRKEEEMSFLNLDKAQMETRSLTSKLKILNDAVKERDVQINNFISEGKQYVDLLKKLEDKNKLLLSQLMATKLKLEVVQNECLVLSTKSCAKSRWIDDDLIDVYFQELSKTVAKGQCLLFGPSVTHNLKMGSPDDVLVTLRETSFSRHKLVFFCVNNSEDVQCSDSGSHWSLLLVDNTRGEAYHFDSMLGCNELAVIKLLTNMGLNTTVVKEIDCFQQKNNFECGLNVITNAKYVIDHYIRANVSVSVVDWYTGKKSIYSESHVVDKYFIDLDKCEKKLEPSKLVSDLNGCVPPILCKKGTQNSWKIIKSKKRRPKPINFHVSKEIDILSENPFDALSNCDSKHQNDSDVTYKTINKVKNIRCKTASTKITRTVKKNIIKKSIKNVFSVSSSRIQKPIVNCKKDKLNSLENNTDNMLLSKDNTSKTKIRILADSHGRGLSRILCMNSPFNYDCCVVFKPNATFGNVINDYKSIVGSMNCDDTLIVIAGTNNVVNGHCKKDILDNATELLLNTINTKVIVATLPIRFDNPSLNRTIKSINNDLKHLVSSFEHCKLLPLDVLANPKYYTKFGLHFNSLGKRKIISSISELVFPNFVNDTVQIPVFVTERNSGSQNFKHKPHLYHTSALKTINLKPTETSNKQGHFLEIVSCPIKQP